jgi:hypothetical protein
LAKWAQIANLQFVPAERRVKKYMEKMAEYTVALWF